ncbi:hypothetical protein DVH24_042663 [Malus domestica]|uniref:Uncharacterized protein n=1 Tax=Malus domestica TaxID=3750 RepID=A0A498HWP4_MALDO|nr:hypothetical protein DVH24_042663 [Malus domestica]
MLRFVFLQGFWDETGPGIAPRSPAFFSDVASDSDSTVHGYFADNFQISRYLAENPTETS